MKQLTKEQKVAMQRALSNFRGQYYWGETGGRLRHLPFDKSRTLFGLSEDSRLPCFQFGRQLVHKIVDALLD